MASSSGLGKVPKMPGINLNFVTENHLNLKDKIDKQRFGTLKDKKLF